MSWVLPINEKVPNHGWHLLSVPWRELKPGDWAWAPFKAGMGGRFSIKREEARKCMHDFNAWKHRLQVSIEQDGKGWKITRLS